MNTAYDVVVIGGGPAGSSAACQLARLKKSTLLLDKGVGSRSREKQDLVDHFQRRTKDAGGEIRTATVATLDFSKSPLELCDTSGTTVTAHTVILATGAAARTNYLHGEQELSGRGVSYDVLTDGPEVNQQTVAVVGKTTKACDESLLLTRFASKVHLIIPSAKLDVPDQLLKRFEGNSQIERLYSASVKSINGSSQVQSLTILTGGDEKDLPVAAVFVYLYDYQPTTEYLKGQVEMADGKVLVDDDLATSVKGVFACGDILCGQPQLPMISAAQGLIAGLSVEQCLTTSSGIK